MVNIRVSKVHQRNDDFQTVYNLECIQKMFFVQRNYFLWLFNDPASSSEYTTGKCGRKAGY